MASFIPPSFVGECGVYEQHAENIPLVARLGKDFFEFGIVDHSQSLESILTVIKTGFEDGSISDDDVVTILEMNNFVLLHFLLSVVNSRDPSSESDNLLDMASRCLAFAGSIYPTLWCEALTCAAETEATTTTTTVSPSTSEALTGEQQQHRGSVKGTTALLDSCLIAALQAVERISYWVFKEKPSANRPPSKKYLGYDERDKADFNMEGYDEEDDAAAAVKEAESAMEEMCMVWLLVLCQMFCQPLPNVTQMIEEQREGLFLNHRKNSKNSAEDSTNNNEKGAVVVAKEKKEQEDGEKEEEEEENEEEIVIHSNNLVGYFSDLVSALLHMASRMNEDSYLLAVKVTAVINLQFSLLVETNTTEIAQIFASVDASEECEVNLSQGLLHILNENGYPNITITESPAVLRLCTDLFHVSSSHHAEDDTTGSSVSTGHFYTNDVKIIVDIIVRELRNIPFSRSNGDHDKEEEVEEEDLQEVLLEQARYMYLELTEAVVSKSTWSTTGYRYLADELRVLLEDCGKDESSSLASVQSRDYAAALLVSYAETLSS